MFPKKKRVGRKLFGEVTTQGALLHSLFCTLRIARTDLKDSRYAVVVSKKVASHAVLRNLLKRRVYAALKDIDRAGFRGSCIVFLKKEATKMSFSEMKKELTALFGKIK